MKAIDRRAHADWILAAPSRSALSLNKPRKNTRYLDLLASAQHHKRSKYSGSQRISIRSDKVTISSDVGLRNFSSNFFESSF